MGKNNKGIEEINRLILGFGCEAEVLRPKRLRKEIKKTPGGWSHYIYLF